MCSVRLAEHCTASSARLHQKPWVQPPAVSQCPQFARKWRQIKTLPHLTWSRGMHSMNTNWIWYDHVNNLWIYDVNILIGTVHVTSVLFKASYTFAWWISRVKLLTVASRYCRYCETLNLVLALSKISQTVKGRRAIWAMRKWCDFQTCFINLKKCHTCFITQLPGICQVLGHIVAQSPWPPHRF